MSQIDELQSRITAALDRISQGLEQAGPSGGADAEAMAELQQQLEDEKTASAQLEERNKRLKAHMDEIEAGTKSAQDEQRKTMKKLDDELQGLRRANQQLRDNNQALREAIEAGVAEPHLINKAMLAELEGLRAARNADCAETDAVMVELTRLLNGPAATESEDA